MEVFVLALAIVCAVVLIVVRRNAFELGIAVLAALPMALWDGLSGRLWGRSHQVLRAAVRGTRRELRALGVATKRVTITSRWPTGEPPLDVILWFVVASDAEAETAVALANIIALLRGWLLARGWSSAQVEDLMLGIVTEQEIDARGGDFHFGREGYRPDPRGRVGSAA